MVEYNLIAMSEFETDPGEDIMMAEKTDIADVELRLHEDGDINNSRSRLYAPHSSSSLHQLARDGHLSELSVLLQKKSMQDKINNLDEKKCSPLHYACRYSHVGVVQELLHNNAQVDRVGSDKMTPFHYACRYGRNGNNGSPSSRKRSFINLGDEENESEENQHPALVVLQFLIEHNATVCAVDAYEMTGLHHAAMRGNLPVVQFLVQHCPEIMNMRDVQGCTALHVAATYGQTEVARILLEAGADLSVLCNEEQTALHRASQEGSLQVMKVLAEREEFKELASKVDHDDSTILHLAVDGGCVELVEFLLELDLEYQVNIPNKEGELPLHSACRAGLLSMVNILVDHNADKDKKNQLHQTPLYLAAQSGNLEILQFLLDRSADHSLWDLQRFSPVMIAAVEGHTEIVQSLLEAGSSITTVDKDDHNILHLVSKYNQPHVLQELLSETSCINLINDNDQYDETPLHIAANEGNVDCVRILLEHGADIDNKNEDEQTPCHLAASAGHPEVIKVILEKDKNAIFDKDEEDDTPLHLAAKHRRADCLKVLLENNAKVQDRNNKIWTALDCAAASGSLSCVQILLDYDSPVDPLDKKKTTPLHLAAKNGHSKIVSLLLESGADITLTNVDGENALEIAILHGKRSVAEAILDSSVWRKSLRTTSILLDTRGVKVPNTPVRMLIRTFPDLAEKVFDNCIKVEVPKQSRTLRKDKRSLNLDFEFLDDTFSFRQVGQDDYLRFDYSNIDDEDRIVSEKIPYHSNGAVRMENHPLMIMSRQKEKQLLKHPLCVALVRSKWKAFGRYIYYAQLLMYICYLISITSYTLITLNEKTFPNASEDTKNGFDRSKAIADLGLKTPQWLTRILVIVFTVIGILFELQQLVRMRQRYFTLSNTVDWFVYVVSIFFVSNITLPIEFDECKGNKCWQWPAGSLLLTLSWLNMLGYIRQLPYFGIYVIMFFDILKTVMKLSIILVIFFIAFGLGFNILLVQHAAFDTFGYSMLKTMVMSTGEYEYEGIFVEDPLPFPAATVFLFVVFLVVMAIIMMNLLVGLAVDDIKEVQEHAELKKLATQVEQVLELEKVLPASVVRRLTANTVVINSKSPTFWKLKDVMSKENIWETFNEREMGGEGEGLEANLNNLRVEITEQMDKMKEEFTDQIRMLKEEVVRLKQE